ncbi:MAG: GNAT family N-acetyltransferase [Bacteroidota bacterium]|jgi:ribosomal protein S18 acetylase RimI-like enzyme
MENIRKATRKDKAAIVGVLAQAFWNEPLINWFAGAHKNKKQRIDALMSFVFEKRLPNGEVYITNDSQAVAIWRNDSSTKFSIYLMWEYLKFLWIFGYKKVMEIDRYEKNVQSRYPKNKSIYYLWMLGTSSQSQGKGLGSSLMNYVLTDADKKGTDTYLETATESNVALYRHKGFDLYDKMEVGGEPNIIIYFMKKGSVG